MNPKTFYLIICEGASEVAYVQELNRFFTEYDIDIILQAKDAQGGGFVHIQRICKKNAARKSSMRVMLDRDLYERNDKNCQDGWKANHHKLPPFLFQYFNFEDFLLMHLPREIVEKWQAYMVPTKHFETPLHGSEYRQQLQAFCKENQDLSPFLHYKKGTIPFALTWDTLKNLFANNTSPQPPHSDFATFLHSLLANDITSALSP